MVKIGIVGLGDIALKAYLPLLATRGAEVHLCSRDVQKLLATGERYRITDLHPHLDELIQSGIQGAFVHTSTGSHFEIVEKLLLNNIHVYVDKPVTYEYSSTEKLFLLARTRNLQLHVGFNRRSAPAYKRLQSMGDVNMILMQKNRKALPGAVRTFVFDDFIHVVDTLLWLMDKPVAKMIVNGKEKDGLLHHLVVQLVSADSIHAIGIMNRDSGTVEETLEVFTSRGKGVVKNLSNLFLHEDSIITERKVDDWASTLQMRGFDELIDHFMLSIQGARVDQNRADAALYTHKVCEEIVEALN